MACATSLTGCVTTQALDQTLSSWVGRDGDDLVRSWGAPSSTYGLKDGGKIISYERLTVQTVGSGEFRDTDSTFCKIDITIDPAGRITDGKWKGANDQCNALMLTAAPVEATKLKLTPSPAPQPQPEPSPQP